MTKLYLSNMPPAMTEEQIRDLFSEIGELGEIAVLEASSAEGRPTTTAFMAVEDALINQAIEYFNGYELMGHHLAISRASPPKTIEPATDREREVAEQIGDRLQENEPTARQQILEVVRFCSIPFAEKLLEEALRIQEAGGMLIPGTDRQRTTGGIFFKLVKDRMASKTRWLIFKPAERKKEADTPKKDKQAKQEKAPKKSGGAPVPAAPKPEPKPAISLEDAQQKLAELQPALQAAQEHLAALKAGPAAKQAGLFSAMKQVVEIQKEIDNLLKEHPTLR